MSTDAVAPALAHIRATAEAIAPYVNRTPVQRWRDREISALLGDTEVRSHTARKPSACTRKW